MSWWGTDILLVRKRAEGIEMLTMLPPLDHYIQCLVAMRFLFARHDIEPLRVVLEFKGGDPDLQEEGFLSGLVALLESRGPPKPRRSARAP